MCAVVGGGGGGGGAGGSVCTMFSCEAAGVLLRQNKAPLRGAGYIRSPLTKYPAPPSMVSFSWV